MTILWIYDMPLVPEAGGTERITSLVSNELIERGYTCLGILEFKQGSKMITYKDTPIKDLYGFLKENKVDIVINQIAYSTWLLNDFLIQGGDRWHSEGGKIISCLHFDPCNPSYIQLLKSQDRLSFRNRLDIFKHSLLFPYYKHKKEQEEGNVYNYIYKHSDGFVILSDRHRSYLERVMKRTDYSKVIVINNPLTFSHIAAETDLYKKKKTILVCARMSEYHKRISLILKAWKVLQNEDGIKDWCLKIVGEGPDLDRYKLFVKGNRIANVEFYGRQDSLPFYQEASILLLTSSAEGWGLTITEALQNGVVPIVMNSSPVYIDIIDNCHNGYLTPNGDISSFTRCIKSLISNPSRLHAMQCNALASAHRFTIDKTLDKWEKIF